jgi:hypothetical protein
VAKVRERAPAARYDERLVRLPTLGGAGPATSHVDRVDLVAQVLDLADRAGMLDV